ASGAARSPADDPDTDPYGLAAVRPSVFTHFPAAGPAAAPPPARAPQADTHADPSPAAALDTSPEPAVDPAEAASLAGAFAADYLSWDEEDPTRRGRVLVGHLCAPGIDPARLGWSGSGRQRAEFALPGRARADGDGRLLVDVRVRVTPYRRAGPAPAATASEQAEPPEPPEAAGIPAAAPAPQAAGWAALGSYWIRLSVPIVRCGHRLAVDVGEENLGEELEAPPTRERGSGPWPEGQDPETVSRTDASLPPRSDVHRLA
ncbi:MAG: hypothetical protein L0H84_18350, partial [Pseudonocardia sp.]|nr:hypothetical protein [Pseudonocardia sp.]